MCGYAFATSVVSQINFDKQTCFSLGTFPSLQRGGCGINQKSRSHRRAADGVVAHATRFTNAFRSIACERPPRPCLFSERIHFANGASTPPLQGGECTYPKSVSNTKWDTTLAKRPILHDKRLRLAKCVMVIRACMDLLILNRDNRDYTDRIRQALTELAGIARQSGDFITAWRLKMILHQLSSSGNADRRLAQTA